MKDEEKLFTIGGIAKDDVKKMVERHHAFSRDNRQYKDETHVRCVWFPLDEIEYIYKQSAKEGADGIRVYFGNYPDKDTNGNTNKNPNTNTVIFVSTRNGHKDYFTEVIHEMTPENRGEQCQPQSGCIGVEFINE